MSDDQQGRGPADGDPDGPAEGGPGAPWWASGADDLDRGVDPLEAYRAARAAGADDGAGPSDARWEDPALRDPEPPPGATRSSFEDAVEGLGMLARLAGARRDGRPHDPATCRACPWCTLLRAVGESRPEVVEHLGEAVRHLTLAARAMVDAAEDRGGWEKIPLDDDVPEQGS